ncbi:DNA adenine methylase [Campylobacter sp. MIT 99-7217]|uniref:DNA adenine methylase n=1 Tax=Campylobacter sp. MIT 99-7217 TaxID=535091 RepID=UPI00163BBA42|nr:DNA adenine methylase [Campylobacter sp. MIT 99-7217]
MFSNYPTVNYIGNKLKVSQWIIDKLPIRKGKVLDLFCGGCSMSYKFKQHGFCVYANDVLYSNFALAKALIENHKERLKLDNIELEKFYNLKNYLSLQWMVNKLYFDYEVRELVSLKNYSQQLKSYDKFIFLSLLRRAMIRKIPYSRMTMKWEEIVKFRDEELSYQKYKRRRAYHNKPFLYHINKEMQTYNLAVFDNQQKNKAFQMDCLQLIKKFERDKESFDLVYIDPPYPSTMNNYLGFYGGFDKVFEKELSKITDFTKKDSFLDNFVLLLNECKKISKVVALSLNNKCTPSVKDIQSEIQKISKNIMIFEKPHVYKVTGKNNKKIHKELLMVIIF